MAGFASYKERADGELAVMESAARSLIKAGRGNQVSELVESGGRGGLPSNVWEQNRKTTQQQKLYGEMRLWAWACINVIAKRISAQNWCAGHYEPPEQDEKRGKLTAKRASRRMLLKERIPPAIARRTFAPRLKAYAGADIEPDESHQSIWTMDEPNSVQGKSEFLYFTVANMLVTGEFYWLGGLMKNGDGERMLLYAVPSWWIEPDHSKGAFGGYFLKTGDGTRGIPLPRENVARGYFPDPSDPKACMSPLMACQQANKIDQHILQSQEDNFKYGMDPKLLVTVGDVPIGEGATKYRPRLTSAQQRQIKRTIMALMRDQEHSRLQILDGLIGDVKKFQMSPAEMDWKQSGEVVKARVLQTFGVNGYVLGDQVLGSYAQANIAELNFANNVANPIIESISCTATKFLSQFYEDGDTLAVWLETYHPRDEDREDRRWQAARQNNDVTQDEVRSRMGLPPRDDEPEPKRSPLMGNPQTMAQVTALAAQVSAGALTHDNAVQVLVVMLQITEEDADAMMPDDPPEPPPMPALPAPGQPGVPPEAGQPKPQAPPVSEEPEKGWQDQPRDELGRWGEGGGGAQGDSGGSKPTAESPASKPETQSISSAKRGNPPTEEARSLIAEWVGDEGGPEDYARIKKEGEAWVEGEKHEALDAIYKDTQQRLKDANITAVTAYRGIQIGADHPLHEAIKSGTVKEGDEVEIDGATFNSWSSASGAAERFAEYGMGNSRISKGIGLVFERVTEARDIVTGNAIHSAEWVEHEQEIVAKRPAGAFKVRISKAFIA